MSVSSMAGIINQKEFERLFGDALNEEMKKAAEPLIQKAIAEIEARVRQSVAKNLIAYMTSDYNFEIDKSKIVIHLRRGN